MDITNLSCSNAATLRDDEQGTLKGFENSLNQLIVTICTVGRVQDLSRDPQFYLDSQWGPYSQYWRTRDQLNEDGRLVQSKIDILRRDYTQQNPACSLTATASDPYRVDDQAYELEVSLHALYVKPDNLTPEDQAEFEGLQAKWHSAEMKSRYRTWQRHLTKDGEFVQSTFNVIGRRLKR
ncbi:uncharacterized protein I303_100208 [Kwoniella dejecticola CBS 10117]|uniref:Uncharacterized protein n=1 Tax=Kwoniella dejecticola CBS 10117 TaxID=1296121 RepID=A0AAJ8KGN9_9TREE